MDEDDAVFRALADPSRRLLLDLLFERGYGRHHLLEINAFGDFFPGLVDDTGRTVHRAEIEATTRVFGLAGAIPL